MRQGMSFWLANQVNCAAAILLPVRLQLNGAFYELATHSNVQETECSSASATTRPARTTPTSAPRNPAVTAPAALKRRPFCASDRLC